MNLSDFKNDEEEEQGLTSKDRANDPPRRSTDTFSKRTSTSKRILETCLKEKIVTNDLRNTTTVIISGWACVHFWPKIWKPVPDVFCQFIP